MKSMLLFTMALLFLAACHDDEGKLTDDDSINPPPIDTIDTTPDSVVCGTWTVPNEVFSDAIGEVLIFADSTQTNFDTVVCINNQISYQYIDAWVADFCETTFRTAYLTHWLPPHDSTIFNFSHSIGTPQSPYFVSNSHGHICVDYFNDGVYSVDSMQINNRLITNATQFICLTENCDCSIVESFIIELNEGLVAIKRQGVWLTKYN